MTTMNIILIILIINFIADQLLQLPIVVKNKNDNTGFMIAHVVTWGISMWILALLFCYKLQSWDMIKWYLFVMVAHFAIEWPLSRWATSLLHQKKYIGYNAVNMLEALITNIVLVISFMYFMFS